MLLAVEFGPTQDGREGEEEKHRIQEDEPADRRVRVLEKHHQSDEPHSGPPEVQLFRGVVRQRYAESSEGSIEDPHEGIVEFLRVSLPGLELE